VSLEELEALLLVQERDTALDQLRHRREAMPERAELEARAAALRRAEAERADVAERHRVVHTEERRIDDEAQAVGGRAEEMNKRLYSETIASPRELQAMQADIDMLVRRRSDLEDEELEVMEKREALDADLEKLEGEIGTLQPIREVGRAARARGVPFHVDGVGVVGRLPLSVDECAIDLLTLSSNDLCGPPGAGALWVRTDVALAPIILGGGQEGGYRSGTENLPAIVGMGVAADLARNERAAEVARLAPLRDRLLDGLLERVQGARVTGARGPGRLPHHASVVVPGVKADAVLLELDLRGVAASSGSACNLTTGEPSHVLRAIGCSREEYEGSLCFTLGRWTTAAEIDAVLDVLPGVVSRLRRLAAR